MLFTQAALEAIAAGDVTVAFRRWRAARVRPGSTIRTGLGVIAIINVVAIELEDITPEDVRRAGFATPRALLEQLDARDGQLYRIDLRPAGEDPRLALRTRAEMSAKERDDLLRRLARLGARTSDGAWAVRTLRLIASHPATRAAKLAGMIGIETQRFKTRVRQLKELGLTESLEIGYRLSPRGRAVLHMLNGASPADQPLSNID
jgi:hypothetical protein